ncbi:MAG: hypothetical protein FWC27_13360 [Firmicutes bacterium]|nr:hypothetical protein [Bacillota bacterium]
MDSEEIWVLGKLNASLVTAMEFPLQTDEVVLTPERATHIRLRHPSDVYLLEQYGPMAVRSPDYVLLDEKNAETVLLIKNISDTNCNMVLRLALLTGGNPEKKKSIMTFHRIRDSYLKRLLSRQKTLYKAE